MRHIWVVRHPPAALNPVSLALLYRFPVAIFAGVSGATLVTKLIGSAGGRDYATEDAWLAAIPTDLVASNVYHLGLMYPDSVFTRTTQFHVAGFTTNPTHRIHLAAAPGFQHFGIPGRGVKVVFNFAPGTNLYLFDIEQDYCIVEDIEMTYSGGAVASDAIQIRGLRINDPVHASKGYPSIGRRLMWHDLNTVRPGASVVGFSVPGGRLYSCKAWNIGVGQFNQDTRNFSSAIANDQFVGYFGCSAWKGGGDLFRLPPNATIGNQATGYAMNCIGINEAAATGLKAAFQNEAIGGKGANMVSNNNISDDGTANVWGGTGHQTAVTAAAQFADTAMRLKQGSNALGTGLDISALVPDAGYADTSINMQDRHAMGLPWDVGAEQVGDAMTDILLAAEKLMIERTR